MRIDIHQHLWSEPLLELLAERTEPPCLTRRCGLTVLHCPGEHPCVIEPAARDPELRATQLRADGLDLALVAISSPAGIEALPRELALELIDAHLEGIARFSPLLLPWGPVALQDPEADDVDRVLAGGSVGVSLPAGALAGPGWLERSGPLLERAAARGVPVFVHPGPAPGAPAGEASLTDPLWWRALTDYVAQMHAAWLTFVSRGRREHPGLAVVFAMLAGGAPLLSERLATRGGPPVELGDPLTFYDTSSYGPVAIEALAARVGERQLLYGSDRPVVDPIATDRDAELQANAAFVIGEGAALVARRAVA